MCCNKHIPQHAVALVMTRDILLILLRNASLIINSALSKRGKNETEPKIDQTNKTMTSHKQNEHSIKREKRRRRRRNDTKKIYKYINTTKKMKIIYRYLYDIEQHMWSLI